MLSSHQLILQVHLHVLSFILELIQWMEALHSGKEAPGPTRHCSHLTWCECRENFTSLPTLSLHFHEPGQGCSPPISEITHISKVMDTQKYLSNQEVMVFTAQTPWHTDN